MLTLPMCQCCPLMSMLPLVSILASVSILPSLVRLRLRCLCRRPHAKAASIASTQLPAPHCVQAVKSSGGLPAWQAAASEWIRATTTSLAHLVQAAAAAVSVPIHAAAAAVFSPLQPAASVAAAAWQANMTAIAVVRHFSMRAALGAACGWLEAVFCSAVDGRLGLGVPLWTLRLRQPLQ